MIYYNRGVGSESVSANITKKYSLSQVLCIVNARSVVKLALQDSAVVFWCIYIKNWRWKIIMWFTEAYIKIIFVKSIFKIFTLEISNKNGPNILPRPGIRNLYLLFLSAHLAKTVFQSGTNCPLHRLCRKKKLTAKKTERFNLIQKIIPRKWYGGHFEIVIELKKFTIS
jgi:hypothetical protein